MIASLVLKIFLATADHDARATECLVDDYACLEAHDQRVLDVAMLASDAGLCTEHAVAPARCRRQFTLRGGEF